MTAAKTPRARQIARIFALYRERGIDDDRRVGIQLDATGQPSIAKMDESQRLKLIARLEAAPAPPDRIPDTPQTRKIRALWISAYWLGTVRDRSDSALAAWVRRQTGLDKAAWLHRPADAARVTEALKAWLAREAGVDWNPWAIETADGGERTVDNPRACVAEAQWRLLREAGAVRYSDTVPGVVVQQYCGGAQRAAFAVEGAGLDPLIRGLGVRIRRIRNCAAKAAS